MMRNGSLSGQGSDIAASIEYISEIIYETPPPPTKVHSIPPFPETSISTGVPVVRTEEALIVIFVLILWVAAIALFFNRWGKIRMLEPYQPKFHQEHRSSCPMVDINHQPQHRSSFSKFNVNCLEPPPHFAAVPPTYRSLVRPRQNSVFVGSSNNMFAVQMNPPRKTKSAVDIKSLVLNEKPPMSKSMLPMSSTERRPSCTTLGMRRSSCLLSPRPSYDRRPSSCSEFLPGSKDRHTYCNEFLSPMHSFDRRTSTSGDYLLPSCQPRAVEQRRPSFNNVIAQVTAERRPSSSMLRISNV